MKTIKATKHPWFGVGMAGVIATAFSVASYSPEYPLVSRWAAILGILLSAWALILQRREANDRYVYIEPEDWTPFLVPAKSPGTSPENGWRVQVESNTTGQRLEWEDDQKGWFQTVFGDERTEEQGNRTVYLIGAPGSPGDEIPPESSRPTKRFRVKFR